MIIGTDLHLDEDSEAIVFGEVLPTLKAAALAQERREVALLGDLLNIRYLVLVRLLTRLRDTFNDWDKSGITVRLLAGNHDQFDVNGRNVLEVFDHENVTVYSKPTWDKDGLWIPYQATKAKFLEALKMPMPKGMGWSPNTLFIHQGILGAWMNDRVQNHDGVTLEAFNGWANVISGHYHKYQVLAGKGGNQIVYPGSQWQTSANEAEQVKGYGVWKGLVFNFVPCSCGPRYVSLEVESDGKLDLSHYRPTDIVRVKCAAGVSLPKLAKQFAAAGIENHTLTPEVDHVAARLDVAHDAGLDEYAQAYVKTVATPDLDQARLLTMFKELAV